MQGSDDNRPWQVIVQPIIKCPETKGCGCTKLAATIKLVNLVVQLQLIDYNILAIMIYINAEQKHLGCKKGEANQKQQLSDYEYIHSYTCD